MAIYDRWLADDGYSVQGEELDVDVENWPAPTTSKLLTLRLEELTHFDVNARVEARERNLVRLWEAKKRTDIAHLEVHYTCCIDKIQRDSLQELLTCDHRIWRSFTLQGINGFNDFYTKPTSLESLSDLLLALRTVEVLNLHSCTLNRGHGLEAILNTIPSLSHLKELRLQGWQMDRVSVSTLVKNLMRQRSKAATLLSLRSCCFLGDDTFSELVRGLSCVPQLKTLNLSYCNLGDGDIIPLVRSIQHHPSLRCLHIGGNRCVSTESVRVIAEWISNESCQLLDLNLRALWIGISEDGLVQRIVDLSKLYAALAANQSLQRLTLSENYIESPDLEILEATFSRGCKLSFIDVADNPFDEGGAKALLRLARLSTSLESIRFENHFIKYECTDAIKTQVRFNFFDRRLVTAPVDIPMGLWPFALSRAQESCGEMPFFEDGTPDTVFRLLLSRTGRYGLMLSHRIAML